MRHLRRMLGVVEMGNGFGNVIRRHRGVFAVLAAGGLLLGALACEDSEKVPPDESTISLSANPAQIIIDNGQQLVPVTLIATVRNSIGVPLPDQDVRFTTTNGVLTPPAATPVRTDDIGNATSILNLANQGPQVTATSGKATVSLTLTAGTAAICSLTLTPSGSVDINTCDDTFDFTVLAEDCDGEPVEGVRVFFELNNSSGNADAVTGTFTPDSATTDAAGEATTTLTLNAGTCSDKCEDPEVSNCNNSVRVKDQAGFVFSNETTLIDQI